MIRVLVISPNQMVNTLLSQVLGEEEDISVVNAITDLSQASDYADQIDIIGIHADASDGDLFNAIRDLRETVPDASVVVLHTPHLQDLILSYIEAGAAGYVREDQSVSQMLHVLRTVHNHGASVDPDLTGTLVRRVEELHREISERAQLDMNFDVELTEREWEVLECLADGDTNSQISDKLFISTGTVKNHVHSILTKLDVKDRNQAAYWFAWRRQYDGAGTSDAQRDTGSITPDNRRPSLVAASRIPEIRRSIEETLERFCRRLGWQVGHVYLLDEFRDELVPTGIWHSPAPDVFAAFRAATEAFRVATSDKTLGQVLLNTEPTWIVDVRRHASFTRSEAARESGIQSGLFLPLVHGSVMGVLEFYSTEQAEPDPEVVAGIIRSGEQVGHMIDQASEAEEAHGTGP